MQNKSILTSGLRFLGPLCVERDGEVEVSFTDERNENVTKQIYNQQCADFTWCNNAL